MGVRQRNGATTTRRPVKQRRLDVFGSIAGCITALGTVTLGLAVATVIGAALNWNTGDVADAQWRTIGAIGSIGLTVLLFLALGAGGYVAGRMAGRDSGRHGIVLVATILTLVAGAVLAVFLSGDNADIREGIRWFGIPTNGRTWDDTLIGFGAAAPLAMLAGALLGSSMGVRWHDRPGAYPSHGRTVEPTQVVGAAGWRDDDLVAEQPWWQEERVDATMRVAAQPAVSAPTTTVRASRPAAEPAWSTYLDDDEYDEPAEGDLTSGALRGGRRDDSGAWRA